MGRKWKSSKRRMKSKKKKRERKRERGKPAQNQWDKTDRESLRSWISSKCTKNQTVIELNKMSVYPEAFICLNSILEISFVFWSIKKKRTLWSGIAEKTFLFMCFQKGVSCLGSSFKCFIWPHGPHIHIYIGLLVILNSYFITDRADSFDCQIRKFQRHFFNFKYHQT